VNAPGAGPLDGLGGLGPLDPLARDLGPPSAARSTARRWADPFPRPRHRRLAAGAGRHLRRGAARQVRRPRSSSTTVVAYLPSSQTDGREHFARWLARSARGQPIMRRSSRPTGCRSTSVYLSMIESGYTPTPTPSPRRPGLWHFRGRHLAPLRADHRLLGRPSGATRSAPPRRRPATSPTSRSASRRLDLAWAGYNAARGDREAIRPRSTVRLLADDEQGPHGCGPRPSHLRAQADRGGADRQSTPSAFRLPRRLRGALRVRRGGGARRQPRLEVLARAASSTVERLRELQPGAAPLLPPRPPGFTVRPPKGRASGFPPPSSNSARRSGSPSRSTRSRRATLAGEARQAYGVSEQTILKTNGLTSQKQAKWAGCW